jgi:MFS family permease
MSRDRLHFIFLNIGHFIDHLMMLVYATVAALALSREWGMAYSELVPYATPGFVAFGVFSLPAGWLADRWSRHGMLAVFFIGIGLAALATSLARTPLEMALGIFVIGVFAAIYHPVGLAMVVQSFSKVGMAIGINGIWGNMGVASAALITGYFIDHGGWRSAFVIPGLVTMAIGFTYAWLFRAEMGGDRAVRRAAVASARAEPTPPDLRALLKRLTIIIFVTTALSSIVFQAATFALPKVFDERLPDIAGSATKVGWMAFLVFAVASSAQLVVGTLLDRHGPRPVFIGVAIIQLTFFMAMPGLTNWAALFVAIAFMLGAFGQIPINDFMIGKLAKSELRASIYGARYVVSFAALALALPMIATIHREWGFDTLFRVMGTAAILILATVSLLPRRLPDIVGTPASAPIPTPARP